MVPKGVRIPALSVAFVLVGALSACGDDDTSGAGTSTTITIAPTSYVTRQPVTTTTTGTTTRPEPGDPVAGEQEYEVQAGDFLALIAEKFDVGVDEIVNYNQWADGIEHGLFPGEIIKIPPGGRVPEPDNGVTTDPPTEISDTRVTTDSTDDTETTDTTDATETTDDTEPSTGTTQPDNCEPGSYTVVAGDFPIAVAQNFDVTLDQLNAANANTSGYDSFYPGLEIVIPAASDC